jgi:hypothetical protein
VWWWWGRLRVRFEHQRPRIFHFIFPPFWLYWEFPEAELWVRLGSSRHPGVAVKPALNFNDRIGHLNLFQHGEGVTEGKMSLSKKYVSWLIRRAVVDGPCGENKLLREGVMAHAT